MTARSSSIVLDGTRLDLLDLAPLFRGESPDLSLSDDARDAEIAEMAKEDTPPINPLEVCRGIERAMSDDAIIVADGTSCRHQIADGTEREAFHVARVLDMALEERGI